jgi:multidrug efflux pump subunit AcrB
MSELSSAYLKKLKFDPKFKNTWVYNLLTNFRITILIVLAILTAGIFSLLNLPRRINPDVNIPIVFVSTVFPGAGPQTIEEQITKPLEDSIETIANIEEISSVSQDNVSNIVVEFKSNINTDQATADVQTAVSSVTGLPSDSQEPRVLALNFEDVPVITFVLTSNTEEASLMRFSNQLRTQLEDLAQIQRVTVAGFEKTELQILINPEIQQTYKVSASAVQQAVAKALNTYPSGTVNANGSNISISVELKNSEIEKIRNLPVNLSGFKVVLGDIAAVSLISQPNQTQSYYINSDK